MVQRLNRKAESYLDAPPDPRLRPLALAFYKKSLDIDPGNIETYLVLAKAYRQLGRPEEARDCCKEALAVDPASIKAQLYLCMLQIPILYARPEEIPICRQNYHRHLLRLVNAVDLDDPGMVAQAASAIGTMQPFYLPFQGLDDRELQRIYGTFVSRVLAARYPAWAQPPHVERPAGSQPIRVGVAFGHFFSQSVWKVIVKGWISVLDRERFKLFGYSLGSRQDAETEYARSRFAWFVEGPRPFEAWCQRIRKDQLHVLIYPEVGMDDLAVKLAGLRLTPVQCMAWGHSVTTGLPTIDYYLSSELIEPPGAEAHYTEQLVSLPNLSIHYTPLQVESAPLQREDLGLRPSAVVYFCAQSLFKYLPQYDEIYPRIVREVGDCQIVFLQNKKSEPITRQFEWRLDAAFSDYGLYRDDYVVMLPVLSRAAYHALNRLADVYLDSVGWSGGTTTLEAIAYDLPIVTLPGDFFRGRMTYGILRRMGVTETVTGSLDEYVDMAVRLGQDSGWRQRVARQMQENKYRVYSDMECIEGLETFLETIVRCSDRR